MEIKNTFELGEYLYLKTDVDQLQRLVVGIVICIDGGLLYDVSCGVSTTKHYPHELTRDKKY